MTRPIKVPKEIMELVYEKAACNELAAASGLLRALFYKQKGIKIEALLWHTMFKVFPQTAKSVWTIDGITGMATDTLAPVLVVKKPRKPRAVKPADPANSLGE